MTDTEEMPSAQPVLARNRLIGVFRSKSEAGDGTLAKEPTVTEPDVCDRLLKTVKKEVKQIFIKFILSVAWV